MNTQLGNLACKYGIAILLTATFSSAHAVAVTDLTLDGVNADAVSSISTGSGGNVLVADIDLAFGSGFVGLDAQLGQVTTFNGVAITINANNFDTGGTFDINWTDNNNPLILPIYMDFVVAVKASDAAASYLFNNKILDDQGGGSGTRSGTYTISFLNNGGQIPDLSNISLFGRLGDDPTNQCTNGSCAVPVPAAAWLFGSALFGLVGIARKRADKAPTQCRQ